MALAACCCASTLAIACCRCCVAAMIVAGGVSGGSSGGLTASATSAGETSGTATGGGISAFALTSASAASSSMSRMPCAVTATFRMPPTRSVIMVRYWSAAPPVHELEKSVSWSDRFSAWSYSPREAELHCSAAARAVVGSPACSIA